MNKISFLLLILFSCNLATGMNNKKTKSKTPNTFKIVLNEKEYIIGEPNVMHCHLAAFLQPRNRLLIQSYLQTKYKCNPEETKTTLSIFLKNQTYTAKELKTILNLPKAYQKYILKKTVKKSKKKAINDDGLITLYSNIITKNKPTLGFLYILKNIKELSNKDKKKLGYIYTNFQRRNWGITDYCLNGLKYLTYLCSRN